MKFTKVSISFILPTVMVIMSSAASVDADDAVHLSLSTPVPRRLGGFGGRGQGFHVGGGGGKGFGGDRLHDGDHDLIHPDGKDKERYCINFNCTKAEEDFPIDDINCTKSEISDIDLEKLKKEEPEKYNHLGCRCCNDNNEDDEVDEALMMSRGQQQHGGGGSRLPGRGGPHGGHLDHKGKHICAITNFLCAAFLEETETNCTVPEFDEDIGFEGEGEETVFFHGYKPHPEHHRAFLSVLYR
jgi:hypothetical protein